MLSAIALYSLSARSNGDDGPLWLAEARVGLDVVKFGLDEDGDPITPLFQRGGHRSPRRLVTQYVKERRRQADCADPDEAPHSLVLSGRFNGADSTWQKSGGQVIQTKPKNRGMPIGTHWDTWQCSVIINAKEPCKCPVIFCR